jgi:hypothetical protein
MPAARMQISPDYIAISLKGLVQPLQSEVHGDHCLESSAREIRWKLAAIRPGPFRLRRALKDGRPSIFSLEIEPDI